MIARMRRPITLIAGVLAGVLLALGGLYLLSRLWPNLFTPAPTPTPTLVPATATPEPSASLAPTAALDPLPGETVSPLERVVGADATATAAAGGSTTASAGALPISRLDVQAAYEPLGFDFQLARLGDDREHWVASSPDQLALVEIVGSGAAEAASVTVFGPVLQQEEHGPQRALYLLTMLAAVLPGWADGPVWFGDQLVEMARASGDFEAATTQAGVRVTLSQDAALGSITLNFAPD